MSRYAEVRDWIAHDPDLSSRKELAILLAAAESGQEDAQAELADRFAQNLAFGTAGLRGTMAAGPNRMNRAVVRRAAYGLTRWLQEQHGTDVRIVIGYDARHHSADFARDSAAVITAAGARAQLLPRPLPTPLLAYATRYAHAGIMVTASHNPATDNGYKVYLSGTLGKPGIQLVSPADHEIATAISAAPPADEIPLSEGWQDVDEGVIAEYRAATELAPVQGAEHIKIVYTAMHGVGGSLMVQLLRKAGFAVVPVPEQYDPHPDFPTVTFPNPEEPGALDVAIQLAQKERADLIIASDPDADRCAVAVPTSDGWRQLTGDEVGVLLGEYKAAELAATGQTGTFSASIVSSQLLAKIAAHHGQHFVPSLTGFKWIARTGNLYYGYEEAIGYCVNPDVVRDKDGLSAGLLIARLAAKFVDDGGLLGELDRIYHMHGYHLTAPVTIRRELASIAPMMERLRAEPPHALAGQPVHVRDFATGIDGLPATNALEFSSGAARVMIRPSGTEPKLKCYLEVIGATEAPARAALEALTAEVNELLR